MREQILGYAIMYTISGTILVVDNIVRKAKLKKQLKKEEQRDLRKKAEANGWNIVECEYTIETNECEYAIEAV